MKKTTRSSQFARIGADVWNGATITNNSVVVRTFSSISEASKFSERRPKNSANRELWDRTNDASRYGSEEALGWYGVNGGLEEVRKLLETGWTDGTGKLDLLRNDFSTANLPKAVSVRRKRVRSDAGDSLDITRVWSGQMDTAWERCKQAPAATRRYLEIMAKPSINAGTDASVTFWRGAACLLLADIAQNAGYSVAITAVVPVSNQFESFSGNALDLVAIKDYAAPLDMDSLASTVCLCGWFRYVWFSMATQHDDQIRDSFGRSVDVSQLLALADHQIGEVEIITDMPTAAKWVTDALNKLQGKACEQVAA